jgi:LAGLIDADG endonuclease
MKTMKTMKTVKSIFFSFNKTNLSNCIQLKRNINTNLSKFNNFIDPYYISGLTQADGSFSCGIQKIESRRLRFRPKFEIVVDLDSKDVLDLIQKYFNCGSIQIKTKDHSASFIVTNLEELRDIIIPHFKLYPVYFNKLHALNLLALILELLGKKHKNRDNVSIFSLAISMNEASSRRKDEEIKELFSIISPEGEKDIKFLKIQNNITSVTHELKSGFLCGLIDGDGSFNVVFLRNGKILPQLTICLGLSCYPLFEDIKKYLGSSIILYKNKSIYELRIRNLDSLLKFVIPFIDANSLHTEKKIHYEIWKEVCFILKNENVSSISEAPFQKIVDLAYNMNKGGKRRKITKEEYVNLIKKVESIDQ